MASTSGSAHVSGRSSSTAFSFTIRHAGQNFEEIAEQIRQYWSDAIRDRKLPKPDEKEDWKVWLAKKNAWIQHHSLVFESMKMGGSFTVELVVKDNTAEPWSRELDPEKNSQYTYTPLGEITGTTANSLYETALDCFKDFGDYNEISNNCQHYCKVSMM